MRADAAIIVPDSTNAALVEHAATWVAEAGRPLASPADVRRRFGLEERG